VCASIRKQVYELTLDDIRRFPVWEFALDEEGTEGQDESTVRPYCAEAALIPPTGPCVVHADFILADGSALAGYVHRTSRPHELESVQPVIITEAGQVAFWYGSFAPSLHIIAEYYRRIGKTVSETFPVRFRSSGSILENPVQGMLDGFFYCAEERGVMFSDRKSLKKSVK
jgi:hypothetical protein